MFATTNKVKNNHKENWGYSGYGITFDSASSWSFDQEYARNIAIFGVDNSLSSHDGNHKNTFLVLAEVTTFDINVCFGMY